MKLLLENTIADGYRFLFTRIVSIIGTVWLPYLIVGCAALLFGYVVLPQGFSLKAIESLNIAALITPQAHLARLLFTLVSMVASAMVTVNLMAHSLGLKEKTTWVYFSLGAPVWRMLGALILAGFVLGAIIAVIVLIAVVAGYTVFQRLDAVAATASTAGIVVVAVLAALYCFARLIFFLPAVVVAENRVGFGRAWALGKGNFWRIVVVWLAIAVPVWIVVGAVLQVSVLPILLSVLNRLPRHPSPEEFEPVIRAILAVLPVVLPVAIVTGIAVRAFMAGAIGSAYKFVTQSSGPKEDSV